MIYLIVETETYMKFFNSCASFSQTVACAVRLLLQQLCIDSFLCNS